MAKGTRDQVRSTIFKGSKFKTKEIEILGAPVEIRQPSLGDIIDYRVDDENNTDRLLDMLIRYCYVPGTQENVFEEADKASLKELPFDAWLTSFNEAVSELSGIDVVDAEKNLS